jgi:hypothetical protein
MRRRDKTREAAEAVHRMNLERRLEEFMRENGVTENSPPEAVKVWKALFELGERLDNLNPEEVAFLANGLKKIEADEEQKSQDALAKSIEDARAAADRPLPGLRHKTEFPK